MPFVAFTCECRCLFGRYISEGQPWEARCRLCGATVTNGIGPHGEGMKVSHLRLPNDQYDYISPIDGKHIRSKHAHRDHMKRHGVIELGNERAAMKPPPPPDPRPMIREEMKIQVERMKSDGTWRER